MRKSNKSKVVRRGIRLRTASDVRRALSRVFNGVLSGELEPGIGGKLAYIGNVMLHAVELSTLEKRVVELEAVAREIQNRGT